MPFQMFVSGGARRGTTDQVALATGTIVWEWPSPVKSGARATPWLGKHAQLRRFEYESRTEHLGKGHKLSSMTTHLWMIDPKALIQVVALIIARREMRITCSLPCISMMRNGAYGVVVTTQELPSSRAGLMFGS